MINTPDEYAKSIRLYEQYGQLFMPQFLGVKFEHDNNSF